MKCTRCISLSFSKSLLRMNAVNSPLQAFEASWSSKGGVETIGTVSHGYFDNEISEPVRGLCCQEPIEAGTKVVSLKLVNSLRASEGSGAVQPQGRIKDCIDSEVWAGLLGTTRLSIILLNEWVENNSNSNSKFKEYMDILPLKEDMNTPIHWEEEGACLDRLQQAYPVIVAKTEKQRKSYKRLYEILSTTAVGESGSQAFIPDPVSIPYDRFVWSMECVSARAFRGVGGDLEKDSFRLGAVVAAACVGLAGILAVQPAIALTLPGGHFLDRETLAQALATIGALALMPSVLSSQYGKGGSSCVLLPVIDSCNHHSRDANCEMYYDVANECFTLRTTAHVPAHEQLSLSYGKRDNDDLLQYFGFVEIDNPHDKYEFLRRAPAPGVKDRVGEVVPPSSGGQRVLVTRGDRDTWDTPGVIDDKELKEILLGELRRLVDVLLELELERVKVHDDDDVRIGRDEGGSRLLAAFLKEKRKVLEAALVRL